LEVWKTCEESHGSPGEMKKVEGLMPIVSKRRVVDQETGQTVEGMCIFPPFYCNAHYRSSIRLGPGVRR
jgi:hypothetical protein